MQRCFLLLASALPLLAHAQATTTRPLGDIWSSFVQHAPWDKIGVLLLLAAAAFFALRKRST